jgi:hypothetical protein
MGSACFSGLPKREARITRSVEQPWPLCVDVRPESRDAAYALNELPQPQVVFACGFLMEKPEPCTLST